MGSLCSKPDTHTGSHQVLGSGPATSYAPAARPPKINVTRPSNTAQSSTQTDTAEERRQKALQAAEARQQKVRSSSHIWRWFRPELVRQYKDRLINKSNPKAGKLASQVNKPLNRIPANPREEQPLRVRLDCHAPCRKASDVHNLVVGLTLLERLPKGCFPRCIYSQFSSLSVSIS